MAATPGMMVWEEVSAARSRGVSVGKRRTPPPTDGQPYTMAISFSLYSVAVMPVTPALAHGSLA